MSGGRQSHPPDGGVAEVEIETWAAGGRGLGRVNGRVWMVVGAVPGDRVEARATKARERLVEAVAVRTVRASTLRRPLPCAIQPACGGCPMMPVAEPLQHGAKRRIVIDALRRIGRFPESLAIDDVVPLPPFLAYRNKIELSFSGRRPRRLGYHRADLPSSLIDVESCAIADPRLQPLLDVARSFFLEGPGSDDPALDDPHGPVRLILRASATRNERLIALRGSEGPFRSAPAFARAAVAADPALVGVVRLIAGARRRGGAASETIVGRSWITEEIDGTEFRVPAGTFLQVHPAAADRLLRSVLDHAESPHEILELYGGIGLFGLALARRGARATIVDADAAAIACGEEAARRLGLSSARFERADVHAFLSARTGAPAPDLVLADPPRTGLGRGVAGLVAAIGAPRIAIISCDPATLARDLAELAARGYAVDGVTPFDFFPQTAHVETVTWLRQGSGSDRR